MIEILLKKKTDLSDKKIVEENTKSSNFFDKLTNVLVYLVSVCILIGAVFFAFNSSPTKSVLGYRYYTVLTASMSPTYNVGDIVFVKLKDSSSINVDDVITFNPSGDSDAYLTHRVVEKFDNYEGTGVTCFRTKGDANDSSDSFLIDEDRVIGTVVFGIPKLGYVIRFVQLRWYFVAAIFLMIVVFIRLLRLYFKLGEETENDYFKNESENIKLNCGESD